MTDFLEHDDDLLEQMTAVVAACDPFNSAYADPNFAEWLACTAANRLSPLARAGLSRDADTFAAAMAARIAAARVGRRYPRHALQERRAAVRGTFAQTVALAARERCAPRVDLRVAAGVGRELWDEACDAWVELPMGVPRGEYVALTVSGDSMTPFLEDGDVILVNPRGKVARDSVIVARRPEDGYVVKHVARVGRVELELASLNPAYAPFTIARNPALVVGTVVARLGHDDPGEAACR